MRTLKRDYRSERNRIHTHLPLQRTDLDEEVPLEAPPTELGFKSALTFASFAQFKI